MCGAVLRMRARAEAAGVVPCRPSPSPCWSICCSLSIWIASSLRANNAPETSANVPVRSDEHSGHNDDESRSPDERFWVEGLAYMAKRLYTHFLCMAVYRMTKLSRVWVALTHTISRLRNDTKSICAVHPASPFNACNCIINCCKVGIIFGSCSAVKKSMAEGVQSFSVSSLNFSRVNCSTSSSTSRNCFCG